MHCIFSQWDTVGTCAILITFFPWTLDTLFCYYNPCKNGGTCEEVDHGFKCNCAEGFTGKTCQGRRFSGNVCWSLYSVFGRDIEDITCSRVDMNFIFECSTRYLMSELSERVRHRVEHEKIKFISTSGDVIFCLLYKHTNNDAFEDFPKISDHFPKMSEDFPKLFRRPDERFRTFSERLRIFSEDCRSRPKKIRRCFDRTATNSSVVEGTREMLSNMISWLSYFF